MLSRQFIFRLYLKPFIDLSFRSGVWLFPLQVCGPRPPSKQTCMLCLILPSVPTYFKAGGCHHRHWGLCLYCGLGCFLSSAFPLTVRCTKSERLLDHPCYWGLAPPFSTGLATGIEHWLGHPKLLSVGFWCQSVMVLWNLWNRQKIPPSALYLPNPGADNGVMYTGTQLRVSLHTFHAFFCGAEWLYKTISSPALYWNRCWKG